MNFCILCVILGSMVNRYERIQLCSIHCRDSSRIFILEGKLTGRGGGGRVAGLHVKKTGNYDRHCLTLKSIWGRGWGWKLGPLGGAFPVPPSLG